MFSQAWSVSRNSTDNKDSVKDVNLTLCMSDLSLVLRDNGYSGDGKLCQPDQILSPMQNFVEKWKDTSDCHRVNVYTADTIAA